MSQKPILAIDFACLILSMCTLDFLPSIEGIVPDMSDICHEDDRYNQIFHERLQSIIEEKIKTHPMGQHFLEKGYSFYEIRDFIIQVRTQELCNALEILKNE